MADFCAVDAHQSYLRHVDAYDRRLSKKGFHRVCDFEEQITPELVAAYFGVLDSARTEGEMHPFLAKHLPLAVNVELAHGCRWIRSEPALGDYRADFAIARMDSGGLRWTLVELQDPSTDLFLKTGTIPRQPSKELREALHQIGQWRSWITHWGSDAMPGYGLPGLTAHFRAVIVIGRAADKLDDLDGDHAIPALEQQHAVTIKSYDSLARGINQTTGGCGVPHTPH
jgi:Domain of unknown function (DUF4263)